MNIMRKVIIEVAPVSSHGPSIAGNPLSPEDIAADVYASAQAGASFAHLHVRDREGKPTEDLTEFSRTLELIRKKSDIIIEGSTGSRVRESVDIVPASASGAAELSLDERCVAIKDHRVEVATLNMGSMNFGEGIFINSFSDIRYWATKMSQANVRPELIIFDSGMINNAKLLAEEGYLIPPFLFNFTLGIKGAIPANVNSLHFLASLLPPRSVWGCVHTEMSDLSLLATAIGMGANLVRVGFEDSAFYAPGKAAKNNAELVGKVAEIVRLMGLETATPAEARQILGM